jgi:hypothetical protein
MPWKNKIKRLVFAMLILVPVSGLLTGGMTYGTNQWFGGQRTIQLENGTKAGLWLRPTHHQWDVPFLAHYRGSTPPYTLQIWIADPDPTWKSVRITEVVVEYEGGTRDRRTGSGFVWGRADGGMSLGSGPLKNLVTLHENCTIEVKGSISTESGGTTSLSISHRFEAEPKETFLAPYWWVLGQQG